MRYIFLVTAALLAGCAPPFARYADMSVDASMAPYTASLIDGAKLWEPLGAHLIVVDWVDTKTVRCEDVGDASAISIDGIAVNCAQMAVASSAWRQHLMAHELGHLYGLGHVLDPEAIMYPYVTEMLELTAADVDEFRLANGLD